MELMPLSGLISYSNGVYTRRGDIISFTKVDDEGPNPEGLELYNVSFHWKVNQEFLGLPVPDFKVYTATVKNWPKTMKVE